MSGSVQYNHGAGLALKQLGPHLGYILAKVERMI